MQIQLLILNDVLKTDSSEKIISILSIAVITMTILVCINLFKVSKLKAKIKQLEGK